MNERASILYVMASRSEYGPCLQSKRKPFMLGIGPVEAGVSLAIELGRLSYSNSLPNLVVSLGSAGPRTLPEKEVFQVTSVAYRDMDVSLLGYEKGCTPLLDLPASIDMPLRIQALKEHHSQQELILFLVRRITELKQTWLIWKHSQF